MMTECPDAKDFSLYQIKRFYEKEECLEMSSGSRILLSYFTGYGNAIIFYFEKGKQIKSPRELSLMKRWELNDYIYKVEESFFNKKDRVKYLYTPQYTQSYFYKLSKDLFSI